MLSSSIPTKIQLPFANAGTKNTIPVTSSPTPGLASYTDGFPAINSIPVASGGVAPVREDFNGIFNAITAVQQWQSAGGHFYYDAAFSTAIGGYPKGCTLLSSTSDDIWLSAAENNTVDPNAGPSANWIAISQPKYIVGGGSIPVDHGPSGLNDRAFTTAYQNISNRPLIVSVYFNVATASPYLQMYTGPTSSPSFNTGIGITNSAGSIGQWNLFIVVPPNYWYIVNAVTGSATIGNWWEY